MRPFCASITVLLVCAAATASHADGLRTSPTGATVCKCPGAVYHSGVRRHHRPRAYGRPYGAPPYGPLALAPDSYNPWLPGTFDTAHDRAMTVHFRNPAVTDTYLAERGWPPTPPIHGLYPYRVRAGDAVYQYDGLIGQYVMLAQPDAARAGAAAVQLMP